MKFLSATMLGLLLAASVAPAAYGQQEMQRGRGGAQERRGGGMHRFLPGQSQPSKDGLRQQFMVDSATGPLEAEQRVIQPPAHGHGHERLSPEERQQLRRDINAAGRDIYRRTRAE